MAGALQAVDECTAAHERLDFIQAGRVAYDFFWNQFADWYVEAAKTRLYGSDAGRAATSRQVGPPQSMESACRSTCLRAWYVRLNVA